MSWLTGKYHMAVDFARDSDWSAYVVTRKVRWYEKLWLKLTRQPVYRWKVVDSWTQKEPKPRKYRK